MAAILTYIDNLILYGQVPSYHFVSQPSDTTENIANCINYRIKLKQSNSERNAKRFWVLNAFYHKYAT